MNFCVVSCPRKIIALINTQMSTQIIVYENIIFSRWRTYFERVSFNMNQKYFDKYERRRENDITRALPWPFASKLEYNNNQFIIFNSFWNVKISRVEIIISIFRVITRNVLVSLYCVFFHRQTAKNYKKKKCSITYLNGAFVDFPRSFFNNEGKTNTFTQFLFSVIFDCVICYPV